MGKLYQIAANNNYLDNTALSRRLVSIILHKCNDYILDYNFRPNIYINGDIYITLSISNVTSPVTITTEPIQNEYIGLLMGYKMYVDWCLDDDEFFLGKTNEVFLTKRRDKINKILERINA